MFSVEYQLANSFSQHHCRSYLPLIVPFKTILPFRAVADSGGMRGMRLHPPQLEQKIFERQYFGHCRETANQIRMPFGIIGRTGPGMRQVVGFGDRSTERGTFWGEFRARHCNQWGLYSVRVHFRSDAALFPNYFGFVITGNGDDAANDFNKYKKLRNLKRIMYAL